MTDLVTIAVDTGASGIKVVGAIDGQPCVAFLMAPHCLEIDPNATEKADILTNIGFGSNLIAKPTQ